MTKLFTLSAVLGLLLGLAPAAQAGPGGLITGVTATARNEFYFHGTWYFIADDAVNGNGMVSGEGATGLHAAVGNYDLGWQTTVAGPGTDPWIKVDLGASYDVGNMYVWNGLGGSWTGIEECDIYYSTTDPGNNTHTNETTFNTNGWTLLTSGQAVAQTVNPGNTNYPPTDTIALDVNARYIALDIKKTHNGAGPDPGTMRLSELQFFEAATALEGLVIYVRESATNSVDFSWNGIIGASGTGTASALNPSADQIVPNTGNLQAGDRTTNDQTTKWKASEYYAGTVSLYGSGVSFSDFLTTQNIPFFAKGSDGTLHVGYTDQANTTGIPDLSSQVFTGSFSLPGTFSTYGLFTAGYELPTTLWTAASGTGTIVFAAATPEIDITGDGVSIPDGDTTPSLADDTDFGSTFVGGPTIVKTYTVTNSGAADLTLTNPATLTGTGTNQFTVGDLTSTTLTNGGTATFTVTYTASSTAGVHNATVSLANNDSDENPYTFNITAETTAAPEPEIDMTGDGNSIPDGDTTPSTADDTDFGSVLIGGADIVITYTVTNTGAADLTLTNPATVSGAGEGQFTVGTLSATTLASGQGASFTVTYAASSTAAVHNATLSLANNDSDENPYSFDIRAETAAPEPEIDIAGNSVSIPDGDTTPSTADGTDFGSTFVGGSTIVKTYTVTNTGPGTLTLTDPATVSGAGAGRFTVGTLTSTTLTNGGTAATFTVTYTSSSTAGVHNATVSLANNDSGENPYDFDITAETTGADWPVPGDGYTGPFRIIFCTIGGYDAVPTDIATYNARVEAVAASTSGQTYDVSGITGWRMIGSTAATNARDNTGTTATDGLAASGDVPIYNMLGVRVADGNAALWGTTLAPWEDNPPDYYTPNAESLLAHILNETGGTGGSRTWTGTTGSGATQTGDELGAATVAQADNRRRDMGWISWGGNGNPNPQANGYNHYALSPVIPFTENTDIDVTGNGVSIPDGDTTPSLTDDTDFDFAYVAATPVVKTFTVANTGPGAVILTGPVSISGDTEFAIGTLSVTNLSGFTNATFTVTYTPSGAPAVHTATVSLPNDDSDENPYTFDITAETRAQAPEIAITGNTIPIPDGDTSPSTTDGTDFGSVYVGGADIVKFYTVKNTGPGDLILTNPATLSGAGAGQFSVGALSSTNLSTGWTASFSLTYTASATAAVHNATVSLANNDSTKNPYNFAITAETLTPVPEIDITGLGNAITNGDITPSLTDDTDFGSTTVGGTTIVKTYTVKNTLLATLNLTDPATVSGAGAAQFTVGALSSTALASGQTATFSVTYTPSDGARAVHNATVSLVNNDSDENPYSFDITAETETDGPVVIPPDGTTTYRIAFQTIATGRPTNSTIAWYNAFVTAAATNVPTLAALETTWYCIGSTTTIDARDNTGTQSNGVPGYLAANDVPIYTTDGRRIADDNADLWDGSIQSPIRFEDGTQAGDGTPAFQAQAWTGTDSDGTATYLVGGTITSSFGSGPNGDDTADYISLARGGYTDAGWINSNASDHDGQSKHFLVLSAPIIGVPTPGTLMFGK